jgi:Fe-S-cluster containining protein
VLGRFAQAQEQLTETGMLDALGKLTTLSKDEKRQIGFDYFGLRIPCPFLEEESCSIHASRPSACREYLVTSPAMHCASLNGKGIAMLRHSAKFSSILFSFSDGAGHSEPAIIPLVSALQSTAHGDTNLERKYYAPTLFENFINRLAVLFAQVT